MRWAKSNRVYSDCAACGGRQFSGPEVSDELLAKHIAAKAPKIEKPELKKTEEQDNEQHRDATGSDDMWA